MSVRPAVRVTARAAVAARNYSSAEPVSVNWFIYLDRACGEICGGIEQAKSLIICANTLDTFCLSVFVSYGDDLVFVDSIDGEFFFTVSTAIGISSSSLMIQVSAEYFLVGEKNFAVGQCLGLASM